MTYFIKVWHKKKEKYLWLVMFDFTTSSEISASESEHKNTQSPLKMKPI